MKIHPVEPETFHLVEPLLARWLDDDRCQDTAETIMASVVEGKWVLYGVADGRDVLGLFALAAKETPRGKRYVACPFAVGDRAKEWWPLMDETAETFGRAHGCTEIRQECRPGWAKWMAEYQTDAIVLKRTIR